VQVSSCGSALAQVFKQPNTRAGSIIACTHVSCLHLWTACVFKSVCAVHTSRCLYTCTSVCVGMRAVVPMLMRISVERGTTHAVCKGTKVSHMHNLYLPNQKNWVTRFFVSYIVLSYYKNRPYLTFVKSPHLASCWSILTIFVLQATFNAGKITLIRVAHHGHAMATPHHADQESGDLKT
jgi:hypothetical protein